MIANRKEDEVIVSVSPRLAELVRAATAGMKHRDVESITGLSSGTYQRLREGRSVGVAQLVAFATGLGLDVQDVLAAANLEERQSNPTRVMEACLAVAGLSPQGRVRVMQVFREELSKQGVSIAPQQSAA